MEEVLDGRGDINYLAKEARDLLKVRGSGPIGRKVPRMLTVLKDDSPRGRELSDLRVWAISILLAQEAAKEPSVIAFRREVFGNNLLAHKDVEDWIRMQAKSDGPSAGWLQIPVVPDSEGSISTRMPEELREQFGDFLRWSVAAKGVVDGHPERLHLEYSIPGDPWLHIQPIAEGGVLDRLCKLSRGLEVRYQWDLAQSTMFVLIGQRPEYQGVNSQIVITPQTPTSTRVNLEIDPSLTSRDVADIYQRLRKSLLPQRPRSMTSKHLRLAAFVAERPQDETRDSTMRAWNKEYPESEYPGHEYDNRRNFSRDASQARQRLLHPEYRLPDQGGRLFYPPSP